MGRRSYVGPPEHFIDHVIPATPALYTVNSFSHLPRGVAGGNNSKTLAGEKFEEVFPSRP
jgi:hypothetical protein